MPADPVPGNGEFLLYPNIAPMLIAGSYTLTATQTMEATDRTAAQLPVDAMDVHLEVRSPRLTLPPDQVLSTYPPAESEGAYGSRLPQVVIRRRTLPWERQLAGAPALTPWMALVVVAEGEGTLVPNVAAEAATTAGVTLAGAIDTETANCLEIRQSMVHRIFPTRKDVPLLAHARHVDIADTELMMGDDDGFLAVVVANRLPVSGRDAAGVEIPVKYTACLVNLEQQWDRLLPTAPPPRLISVLQGLDVRVLVTSASMDKHVMGGATPIDSDPMLRRAPGDSVRATKYQADVTGDAADHLQSVQHVGYSKSGGGKTKKANVIGSLGSAHLSTGAGMTLVDPMLRFPVMLHWRFTSAGALTFETLIRNLDSGLLGTVARTAPAQDAGRLPLELVDTGHVGLAQRTRRGDSVRAWYRGPFVPHPTDDDASSRLPLAHAADQLRIVIPDGREDLSLASAFEIGRLLALAHPNMVAALLRWRQLHYATVRRTTVWKANAALLGALDGYALSSRVGAADATLLGRAMMRAVSNAPSAFLGAPRPKVDAGRALPFEGESNTLMSRAFGLKAFRGEPATVLAALQQAEVRVAPVTERVGRVPGAGFAALDHVLLDRALEARVERIVTDAVVRMGSTRKKVSRSASKRSKADGDALDELLTRMARRHSRETKE